MSYEIMQSAFTAVVLSAIIGGCGTDTAADRDTETPTTSEDPEDTSSDSAMSASDSDSGDTGFELTGFSTPESALHDEEADIYLVSNINGSASAKSDNGFISTVSPNGEILDLKWIDGADDSVVLDAPKGMGIFEDILFVADITSVRKFDRKTGEPLGEIAVEDAVFLNDIAVSAKGRVFVSDSTAGFVYVIETDDGCRRFAEGDPFVSPNGLVADGERLFIATDNEILHLDEDGVVLSRLSAPSGFLDGLVLLEDGRLIVSSWDSRAVYITDSDSEFETLFSGFSGAADIGFDATRSRVLMPMLNAGSFLVEPLDR